MTQELIKLKKAQSTVNNKDFDMSAYLKNKQKKSKNVQFSRLNLDLIKN